MSVLRYGFIPDMRVSYRGFATREDKNLNTAEESFLKRSDIELTARYLALEDDGAHVIITREIVPSNPGMTFAEEMFAAEMRALKIGAKPILPLFSGKAVAYYHLSNRGEIIESTDVAPVIFMPLPREPVEPGGEWHLASYIDMDGNTTEIRTDYVFEEIIATADDETDNDFSNAYRISMKTLPVTFISSNSQGQSVEVTISREGYFIYSPISKAILKLDHRLNFMSGYDEGTLVETVETSFFELIEFHLPEDEGIEESPEDELTGNEITADESEAENTDEEVQSEKSKD